MLSSIDNIFVALGQSSTK